MPALLFLRAHWRPFLALALLLGAFAGGRYSAPKPTVTVKTVTQVVTQVKEVKVEAKATHETVTQVVYRDRVVHKDGTVEEKSQTNTTEGVAIQDNTSDATQTATTTKASSSSVTATGAPKWVVYADVGVPLALKAPFVGMPFVVVGVEHQVLGPVYAGPWFSIDVTGKNPAAGVSVGVTF